MKTTHVLYMDIFVINLHLGKENDALVQTKFDDYTFTVIFIVLITTRQIEHFRIISYNQHIPQSVYYTFINDIQ